MKERQFFFAPDFETAELMVGDLKDFGIPEDHLHVIANDEVVLKPLPEPDIVHRSDVVDAAKRGAATGGAIGFVGSVVAVTLPALGFTLGGGAILAGTALGTALGTWFSTLVGVSVPNQEVDEYRHRIDRGELMIIVDCEPDQQPRLSAMLESRHAGTLILKGNLDAA